MTTLHFKNLKQRLKSSEDFSETFDYFFQKFAENTSFYERGERSTNEMLITVLKAVGKNFYGENCQISEYRMTEIEDENFIHGTCFLDEKIVMAIYFTDINLGLASIAMGGARFNFVRLKATPVPEGMGIHFAKDTSVN